MQGKGKNGAQQTPIVQSTCSMVTVAVGEVEWEMLTMLRDIRKSPSGPNPQHQDYAPLTFFQTALGQGRVWPYDFLTHFEFMPINLKRGYANRRVQEIFKLKNMQQDGAVTKKYKVRSTEQKEFNVAITKRCTLTNEIF